VLQCIIVYVEKMRKIRKKQGKPKGKRVLIRIKDEKKKDNRLQRKDTQRKTATGIKPIAVVSV